MRGFCLLWTTLVGEHSLEVPRPIFLSSQQQFLLLGEEENNIRRVHWSVGFRSAVAVGAVVAFRSPRAVGVVVSFFFVCLARVFSTALLTYNPPIVCCRPSVSTPVS